MRTIILVIVAIILSAGCTKMAGGGGEKGDVTVTDCKKAAKLKKCKENKGSKAKAAKVTFDTDKGTVKPEFICVEQGGTIEVRIKPKPSKKGSVAVIPKNAASIWISGANNKTEDLIEITVSSDVAKGDDYYYSALAGAGECVDPRVHVK